MRSSDVALDAELEGRRMCCGWLVLRIGGVLFVGALVKRAILFGVHIGAPDFWKLPHGHSHREPLIFSTTATTGARIALRTTIFTIPVVLTLTVIAVVIIMLSLLL